MRWGGVGGGAKRTNRLWWAKASLGLREAQSPASSDARNIFKRVGSAKSGCTESFWMKGKIPESGQENPRMDLRPAARAWLPLRAPKRKFSKFRFQCPLGSEGRSHPAGICAQGAQRAGKPPRGQPGQHFRPGPTALPLPARSPRPAPRPLRWRLRFCAAPPRAQTKATAEPRRQIEPESQIPGLEDSAGSQGRNSRAPGVSCEPCGRGGLAAAAEVGWRSR